jgi:hypothetical protein
MAKNERTIRMASHILLTIFIPRETFSFTAKQSTNTQGSFPHTWKSIIFPLVLWRSYDKWKQRPDLVQNNFPVPKFFACCHRRTMYEVWAFEHIQTLIAHQKEGQILNDLVKFAGLVKSSKLYLSCNGLRSHLIGTACWNIKRKKKNTEWFNCTIPLTITVLKCSSNNKSECVCHNVIQ